MPVRPIDKPYTIEAVPMYERDPRIEILKPLPKAIFLNGKLYIIIEVPEEKLTFDRVIELVGRFPRIRCKTKNKKGKFKHWKRDSRTLAVIPIKRKDKHYIIYEMKGFREYTQSGETTIPFYDGTYSFQFRIVRADGSISATSNVERIMIFKDGRWRVKEAW